MDSDYLDGPGLVRWTEESLGGQIESVSARLGSDARTIYEWRHGRVASVYAADRVLLKLDLHLSMVPDHLYVDLRSAA